MPIDDESSRKKNSMTLKIAEPLDVTSPQECVWYQTFDLPDGSLIRGRWDYRSNVDDYLGRIDFKGKSVLEIGPASGYLTRALESRGADVLCIDTSIDHVWDVVPRLDRDVDKYIEERRAVIPKLWKGWWLTRRIFNGSARISYSGAASIAELPQNQIFDVALIGSVLQHFENPFVILSHVARRCRTIVVTEQYFPRFDLPGRSLVEFIPRHSNNDLGSWWLLGPSVVEQMMGTLNFKKSSSYFSTFRRWDLKQKNIGDDSFRDARFYTHVYERSSRDASRYQQIAEA
jgi:hypothetical protein